MLNITPLDRIIIISIVLLLVVCFLSDRLYFNRYEIVASKDLVYRIDKITGKHEVYIYDDRIIMTKSPKLNER